MSYSKIVIEFHLPTTRTSYLRISDVVQGIDDLVKAHRGGLTFTTVSGPYLEIAKERENVINSSSSGSPELGRSASSPAPGTPGDEPAKPARRGPGRPRKTETRPSSEPEQGSLTGRSIESSSAGAEAPIEHVARGSGQSPVQGSGESQSGDGGDGRSGLDQRGASAPDRMILQLDDSWDDEPTGEEAVFDDEDWAGSPVEPQDFDEEWHAKAPGDEWPASLMPPGLTPQTIDKTAINTLLGGHFQACGDKTRETTFAVLQKFTGGRRSVDQVDPKDYWKLARCIIKDTKRYEHGLLKPKS